MAAEITEYDKFFLVQFPLTTAWAYGHYPGNGPREVPMLPQKFFLADAGFYNN